MIARDAFTDGRDWGTGDPQTWSHTCTGSNLIIFVYVFAGGATDIVNGITYNGVSMTRLIFNNNDAQSGAGNSHWVYYLVNPATGAHTVSVDLTSSTNISALSVSYTGVDTTSPIVTSRSDPGDKATTTYTTGSFTPTSTTDWLISFIRDLDNRVTSCDKTYYVGNTSVVPIEVWDSNGDAVSTSAQTMTYTLSSSGRIHGVSTVVLKAAAAAPTQNSNFLKYGY